VAGVKMKSSPSETPAWNGTNSSGFSALPGGIRNNGDGAYYVLGEGGTWWSSSAHDTSYAWSRYIMDVYDDITLLYSHKNAGFSVRCIRDVEVVCLDQDNDGVCAENEISGCTNDNAYNFNPSATEEDGSCVMSGPAQCGGASTKFFDGYSYNLIAIGDKCWFKENLRNDNYRNGDEIPGNLSDSEWISTNFGAQAVYGEGEPVGTLGGSGSSNIFLHGRLYNCFAINDPRGLCPTYYHVATNEDWEQLTLDLGWASVADQLKSTASDVPPWNGTNTSGFSGTPSGYRSYFDGSFQELGSSGFWWGTSNSFDSWIRYMTNGPDLGLNYYYLVRYGFSVRCVRD
jgi:uncharacterized protein (TIGR02145 family)